MLNEIKNVRIINFDGVKVGNIVFDESIIDIKENNGKVDFILVPGFIDLHTHGFKGKDAMEGQEAIEHMSAELAKQGTTSFMPTLMTHDYIELLNKIKEATIAQEVASRIIGIHLEGPFISKDKKGAHDEQYIIKPSITHIDKLTQAKDGKLMKLTLAPEEIDGNVIDKIIKDGYIASIGHSNGNAEMTEKMSAKGIKNITHMWNAITGVQNRNPGIVEQALIDTSIYSELICDLIHVDEKTLKLSINSKGYRRIISVTDSLKCAGMPDGDSVSGGLEITKVGTHITLKNSSTLAGSGITMLDNFKNLIKIGFSIEQVVAMTSFNAAESIGLSNKFGKVEKGFKADFLLLDKDYNVKEVYINGKKVN